MSHNELKSLQEELAKAVYSSGAPLAMVSSPYWKKFIEKLRPSFKLPTRHKISGKLLDKVYDEMQSDVMNKISESESLSIISDGWSNIRNESVINIIVATPEPVFYKTVQPGENHSTRKYIAHTFNK